MCDADANDASHNIPPLSLHPSTAQHTHARLTTTRAPNMPHQSSDSQDSPVDATDANFDGAILAQRLGQIRATIDTNKAAALDLYQSTWKQYRRDHSTSLIDSLTSTGSLRPILLDLRDGLNNALGRRWPLFRHDGFSGSSQFPTSWHILDNVRLWALSGDVAFNGPEFVLHLQELAIGDDSLDFSTAMVFLRDSRARRRARARSEQQERRPTTDTRHAEEWSVSDVVEAIKYHRASGHRSLTETGQGLLLLAAIYGS